MQKETVVALPHSPLSLVPYQDSSFYVQSAYISLWDNIASREGLQPLLHTVIWILKHESYQTFVLYMRCVTFHTPLQRIQAMSMCMCMWSVATEDNWSVCVHADPIMITGTPGTGKTAMLLFILQQLSQQSCVIGLQLQSKVG